MLNAVESHGLQLGSDKSNLHFTPTVRIAVRMGWTRVWGETHSTPAEETNRLCSGSATHSDENGMFAVPAIQEVEAGGSYEALSLVSLGNTMRLHLRKIK